MNRVFGRAAIESKNTSIDLSGRGGGLINHILRLVEGVDLIQKPFRSWQGF